MIGPTQRGHEQGFGTSSVQSVGALVRFGSSRTKEKIGVGVIVRSAESRIPMQLMIHLGKMRSSVQSACTTGILTASICAV